MQVKTKSRLVNLVLVGFGMVCLAATVLTWLRNQQLPLAYFGLFIATFYTLALMYLLALGWSFEHKARLILVSIAMAASLLVVEAFLRFVPQHADNPQVALRSQLAKRQGIAFDKRNKFDIFQVAQQQGEDLWPNISPEYFIHSKGLVTPGGELYPLSAGVSSVNTIVCNESGQFGCYQSDEQGFNNPKGIEQADIVIIGDSFAHGACVNQGEDAASHLRTLINKPIINLGNSGVGPLVELAILTEFGLPMKPKTVFWFYFEGNDLADLMEERQSAFLLNYLNDGFSQGLINQTKTIDASLKQYVLDKQNDFKALYQPVSAASGLGVFKLQQLRQRLGLNAPKASAPPAPDGLLMAILDTAKRRIQAEGGELIFVYLPELARFQTKNNTRFNQQRYTMDIQNMVEQLGIRCIDLCPVFASHPDPIALFPLRIEGHYTQEGYALVAEQLAKAD